VSRSSIRAFRWQEEEEEEEAPFGRRVVPKYMTLAVTFHMMYHWPAAEALRLAVSSFRKQPRPIIIIMTMAVFLQPPATVASREFRLDYLIWQDCC
jgi:hypothetical protein